MPPTSATPSACWTIPTASPWPSQRIRASWPAIRAASAERRASVRRWSVCVEAAPAALRQEHEQQHQPGEDEHAFEPRQQVPARADDARPALDVGRHPDLVALGLDQHRLEPLGPAELLDVLGQRRAPALAARRFALAPAGDEELRLERGEGEEGDPGRDRVVQRRHEEPGEHQRDRRDP